MTPPVNPVCSKKSLYSPGSPLPPQDRDSRIQALALEPVINLEKTYASMRDQKRQVVSALKVTACLSICMRK